MDMKFIEMCKVALAKNILKFTNQVHVSITKMKNVHMLLNYDNNLNK